MANPPQAPAGYTLDAAPAQGAPKLPMGYTMDRVPPPAPPDVLTQDKAITDAWAQNHPILGPVARFLVAGGQAAGQAITQTPSFVYHSVVDPAQPNEATLTPEQRIAGRLIGVPQMAQAAVDYSSGMVTPQNAVSVLPEALGQGVGNVAGSAVYGKAGEAAKVGAGELNRVVPSTTRAGTGHGMLEQWYAEHPTTGNRFLDETNKIEQELGTVGTQLPAPLAYLRDRLQAIDLMRARGLPVDDFTFGEARTALKQLNNQINFQNPTPANALYRRAAGALADDIMESTGRPSPVAPKGFQADYQRMVNETRQGNQAIRVGEKVGPVVGALAGYGLGRELGAPLGAEFLMGYGGKLAGRSVAGSLVHSVIEREGGPPNISAPPAPPSTPPPAPPVMAAPSTPLAPPTPPVATSAPPTPPAVDATTQAYIDNINRARAQGTLGTPRPNANSPITDPIAVRAWQESAFGQKPLETNVQGKEAPRNAKVLGQAEALTGKAPEVVGERRAVDRVAQQAEDKLFTQARDLLGGNPSSEAVLAKVAELKLKQRAISAPPAPPGADRYTDAKQLVQEFGKGSTALLQRRLKIGYADATRYIDRMKSEGLFEDNTSAVPTVKGSQPPPPPPKPIARNLPPEAYTRFLLAAKEGDISPGELERRMAKYGAGNVVRPLSRG